MYLTTLQEIVFNPCLPTIMHLDLNSCFATIEQQANPFLRGKPIVVAAYNSPRGCILAPSIEAKTFGIKTGMRVFEAQKLCSNLLILPPDPWKYRNVHLSLRKLVNEYTDKFTPRSIDEFVLDFSGMPALKKGMISIGKEIKNRIKKELGDWLSVSIGIGPNRFLAKTAAGLKKPDGLEEINKENYLGIYLGLTLTDLCGIAKKNEARLNKFNIKTVLDFYNADLQLIKTAFHSIIGYDWYLRLRGWEIDDGIQKRSSYGNSFSLPKPFFKLEDLSPILQKLVEKSSFRLKSAGYKTQGVHLGILYRNGVYWHKGKKLKKIIFETRDIFREALNLLKESPYQTPVANLAVSYFSLKEDNSSQLEIFEDVFKKERLSLALDKINKRWGNFAISSARMIKAKDLIQDRIAFGGVKELEELILGN